MRKISSLLLTLCVLIFLALPAGAQMTEGEYIRQLLRECLSGGASEEKISDCLSQMAGDYPQRAQLWSNIMDSWFYINGDMEIQTDVLPDGLPQDDSLCIVVMGYQLNYNGSIKPELLDRLSVAVRSAEKYPNAYILCTGGPTSGQTGITEAGEMALWLKICGIDESRIIVEDNSYSTTENAKYSLKILCNQYPQVKNLAIVTSDYHIRRSCMLFQTAAILSDNPQITVVANAACTIDSTLVEGMYSQLQGMAILAGVEMPT